MNKLLYILFINTLLLILNSCTNEVESPYPSIVFSKLQVMPGTGRASAVAFVVNNKAYVTLGRNLNTGDSLKECWEFDPVNKNWSQKRSFPGNARVKAIALVHNGIALVGLGFKPHRPAYTGGYYKDLWAYDPQSDTWTKKADFPSNATDACVSFVANNTVYVGFGYNGYKYTKELWKYNYDNDVWIRLSDPEIKTRISAVACSTESGRTFIGSGWFVDNFNDWWEYIAKTNSWKQRASFPDRGRLNASAITIGNRIFVSTGRYFKGSVTGGHLKSDVLEYDITKDCWYNRGSLTRSGRENALSFSINGVGYIGFGENNSGVLNDFWTFVP